MIKHKEEFKQEVGRRATMPGAWRALTSELH